MLRTWLGFAVAFELTVSVAFAQYPPKAVIPVEKAQLTAVDAAEQQGRPSTRGVSSTCKRLSGRQRQGVAAATPHADTASPSEALTVLKSEEPKHVRFIYHVNNVPAREISNTAKQLFQLEGRLRQPDGERTGQAIGLNVVIIPSVGNSVLISGSSAAVHEVLQLLEKLDRPEGAVLVDMEFGEAPVNKVVHTKSGTKPEGMSYTRVPSEQVCLAKRPAHMKTTGRIRLTTLSNLPAFVSVRVRESVTATGPTNPTTMENADLKFRVTPRINDDKTITMTLKVVLSGVGPESEGTPIPTTGDKVTRTHSMEMREVNTTVQVADGQTAVLATACQGELDKQLVIIATPHIVGLNESKKVP